MIAILVQYQGLVKQNSYCFILTFKYGSCLNQGQRGNVGNSAYFGILFVPNLTHCIGVIFTDFA